MILFLPFTFQDVILSNPYIDQRRPHARMSENTYMESRRPRAPLHSASSNPVPTNSTPLPSRVQGHDSAARKTLRKERGLGVQKVKEKGPIQVDLKAYTHS